MKRDEALEVLADCYPDGIAVAVYQSAFDWMKIRPHPLNYLCTGAMGQACSHALGLALGAPNEKVIVLDGDGSLMMNLGALITIANMAPRNLVHFVCQNNTYEVNGKFPVPGADIVNFDGIAREAGYETVFSFKEIFDFKKNIGIVLKSRGPVFVCMHVEPGKPYPTDYITIHSAESRKTFREALHNRLKDQ